MSNNNSINFNINLLVTKTLLTTSINGVFAKQTSVTKINNSLNNFKHKDSSM